MQKGVSADVSLQVSRVGLLSLSGSQLRRTLLLHADRLHLATGAQPWSPQDSQTCCSLTLCHVPCRLPTATGASDPETCVRESWKNKGQSGRRRRLERLKRDSAHTRQAQARAVVSQSRRQSRCQPTHPPPDCSCSCSSQRDATISRVTSDYACPTHSVHPSKLSALFLRLHSLPTARDSDLMLMSDSHNGCWAMSCRPS